MDEWVNTISIQWKAPVRWWWQGAVGRCDYKVRAGGSVFWLGNNVTILFPDSGGYTNVLKLIELYTKKTTKINFTIR